MWRKEPIADRTINEQVSHQLISRGMRSPCNITVQAAKGVVTLSGKIEYEHQRSAALQLARRVDGVGRVIDQLHVAPKTSQWK